MNGVTNNYATGVGQVIVSGPAGNDNIDASAVATIPVELIGGNGSDTLLGGAPGDDVLTGNSPGDYGTTLANNTDDHAADSLVAGAGNDTLDGGLGNDTMAGGTGNDYYIEVPGSDDLLTESGAAGIDTVDFSKAYAGITFSLAITGTPQAVSPSVDASAVTIQGQFENLTGSHIERQSVWQRSKQPTLGRRRR